VNPEPEKFPAKPQSRQVAPHDRCPEFESAKSPASPPYGGTSRTAENNALALRAIFVGLHVVGVGVY